MLMMALRRWSPLAMSPSPPTPPKCANQKTYQPQLIHTSLNCRRFAQVAPILRYTLQSCSRNPLVRLGWFLECLNGTGTWDLPFSHEQQSSLSPPSSPPLAPRNLATRPSPRSTQYQN